MMPQTNDVPPPGDFIREELEARGWSQRDLAYVLGASEQGVNLILSGKRGITADMARALGDAFDVPAEFFMNLQKSHDLANARQPHPSVKLKGKLQVSYPVREMIKRGWLVDSVAELLELQMVRFFGVANTDDIPHVVPHAAKKTFYDSVPPSQLAWLCRVKQIAKEMVVPAYSLKAGRAVIDRLGPLRSAPEETRHVAKILSEAGIRFLVVECLTGAKIDGVCLWLNNGSPVIALSLRQDRIDNFWFVLRHELEHVLRGHGRASPIIDVDLGGEGDGGANGNVEEEKVANDAATDFCVPSDRMASFIARKSPFFSEKDLLAFSALHGIHPGLVAGQIRNRTKNWKLFSKFLVKVRFAVLSGATVDGWGAIVPVTN